MKSNLFMIAAAAFSSLTSVIAIPLEVGPAKLLDRQETTYLCGPSNPATFGQLVSPKNGDRFYIRDLSYVIELIYCSAEYFKTRSLGLTIGLARPEDAVRDGQILALDYKPSDEAGVAQPGYYGYKFNVTIPYPSNGVIIAGNYVLTAGEVTTGYYNANNYHIKSAQISFAGIGGYCVDC